MSHNELLQCIQMHALCLYDQSYPFSHSFLKGDLHHYSNYGRF